MALLGSSDNSVNITVSSKADTKGIDDTSKSLNSLDGQADSSSSKMNLLGGAAAAAKVAFVALAAGAAAASVAVVKNAADFEQTRIGLENMLGSADQARTVLAEVSKFAADTPFQFPELANATRQLVAFGFSGQDAFNTMKQLGDVSAAVGAPIGDLAYLMGTLKTQGRAFTIDIRQFAQRGIPIYEYLGKTLHKTTAEIDDMITAGQIGFPEVAAAFDAMTSSGGAFYGTMDKQSRSLSGLWSTLTDNIGQAGRQIIGINQQGDIAQGSIFQILENGLSNLNAELPSAIQGLQNFIASIVQVANSVGSYLGPKLDELWNKLNANIIPALIYLWQNVIIPLAPVVGTLLVGAVGALLDALNGVIGVVNWFVQGLRDGNPATVALTAVIGTLAGAFVILQGAMMLGAAFDAMKIGFATLQLITIPSFMATMGTLKAFVSAPMTMGSIAVAGALADIYLVLQAVNTVKGAIEAMNNAAAAKQSAAASDAAAHQQIVDLSKNGTADQKARANALLAKGFASGGFTGQGGQNEIAGVVHKGEYVVPQSQVDQSTGLPKMGGNVNLTQNIYNQVDYDKGIAQIGFMLRTRT